MTPLITAVTAQKAYRLRVDFDDETWRIVDVEKLINRRYAFRSLKDPIVFAKVFLHSGTHTATWPGGIDINPQVLHGSTKRRGVLLV
ncbi:MAG: DUF2442 domain-containing protein [Segetibacter sp.]